MGWFEVGRENWRAADALLEADLHRSMVSRAYFAAYARATHALSDSATFPRDWEGPKHNSLRRLIEVHLIQLSLENRQTLSTLVGQLYDMRLDADYHPSNMIDAKEARLAHAMLMKCLNWI